MTLNVPPDLGVRAAADEAGAVVLGGTDEAVADEAAGAAEVFGAADGEPDCEHPIAMKDRANRITRGIRNFFINRLQF
jgi:hypothetical protein